MDKEIRECIRKISLFQYYVLTQKMDINIAIKLTDFKDETDLILALKCLESGEKDKSL